MGKKGRRTCRDEGEAIRCGQLLESLLKKIAGTMRWLSVVI